MTDIVEWLRISANDYGMGRCDTAADDIEDLRADLQKLNERNAEYIGTIDRLRRRVAETDVEIERLRDVMKTAIRQFEDGNRLSCHRTLCDEVYGRQT